MSSGYSAGCERFSSCYSSVNGLVVCAVTKCHVLGIHRAHMHRLGGYGLDMDRMHDATSVANLDLFVVYSAYD